MIDRAIVDEEIHPESEFENQFTPVEVTAETFPALKNSLYTEAPDVDISSAQNQVSYKLYNDDGELLQTETVPVLRDGQKGDAGTDGADGEQGGGYLGSFAANPPNPVTNDFYLDTTEQTVYYFDGENWVEDELDEDAPLSWRWNAAIQDCISLATGSGNFVKAANIWVNKLTANTALITALFSKAITILNNGVIKSENYDSSEGANGFCINADGKAIFNNDTIIRGSINNTVIKADAPSELEAYEYDGELYGCAVWVPRSEWMWLDSIQKYVKYGTLKYLDEDRLVHIEELNMHCITFENGVPVYTDNREYSDMNGVKTVPYFKTYTINGFKYDVTTLWNKLFIYNLPSEEDAWAEKDSVYVDENGFLKIVK